MQHSRLKQSGFILLVALITLQILSLLGLFALQSYLWESRMLHQFWLRQEMMATATYQMQQAEKKLLYSAPSCLIPKTAAALLITKSHSWWQSVSCHGNFHQFQYYYVMESLGDDACADMEQLQPAVIKSIASYFRITLFMMSSSNLLQYVILQRTVVKPHAVASLCTGQHHRVLMGEQSSRELI